MNPTLRKLLESDSKRLRNDQNITVGIQTGLKHQTGWVCCGVGSTQVVAEVDFSPGLQY